MLSGNKFGWSGDYNSWQEAVNKCTGYNAANILEKVKAATLKVKNGEAAYERDSVLFDKPEFSQPLLSTVLWVALNNNGHLNVTDFGGALGSSYFQNKRFLDAVIHLRWNVIEQPNFVETGSKFIANEKIRFFSTIAEADSTFKTNLLVISCAIQYMEKPYELIEQLTGFNIPYILVDNTPYNYEGRDRITVQEVPPSIYTASYPCWFLDYKKVIQAFSKKYSLVSEHNNEDFIELDGRKIRYQGFLMERKK